MSGSRSLRYQDTTRKILMLHDNLSLRAMDWGEDFTRSEAMSHFQLVEVKIPMLTSDMTQWGFVHGN